MEIRDTVIILLNILATGTICYAVGFFKGSDFAMKKIDETIKGYKDVIEGYKEMANEYSQKYFAEVRKNLKAVQDEQRRI